MHKSRRFIPRSPRRRDWLGGGTESSLFLSETGDPSLGNARGSLEASETEEAVVRNISTPRRPPRLLISAPPADAIGMGTEKSFYGTRMAR
jgi:hypothetical protein